MNDRRNLLRKLGVAGAAVVAAVSTVGAAHAKPGNGQPFQQLRAELLRIVRRLAGQLGRLSRRVEDLAAGQFDVAELQISNPDGGPSSLVLGETGECRIQVDPNGPGGLQLRDPNGVRLLPPGVAPGAALTDQNRPGGTPVLFFGGSDECRIFPGPEGLFLRDPNGINFDGGETRIISSVPGSGEPSLAFVDALVGPVPECRGRVGADKDGMFFEDANAFDFSSSVNVNGTVAAQQFVQISSGRFKENVRPIDDALAKINALQGVYFDWKAEQGGQSDIGFIGEAVNDVLPEVVAERPEDGVTGVKYANIVAVAVEGIKAQQAEIERLEADNGALREQVDTLGARFDALAAKIERST